MWYIGYQKKKKKTGIEQDQLNTIALSLINSGRRTKSCKM